MGGFPFVTKHLKELDSEYGVRRFLLEITTIAVVIDWSSHEIGHKSIHTVDRFASFTFTSHNIHIIYSTKPSIALSAITYIVSTLSIRPNYMTI